MRKHLAVVVAILLAACAPAPVAQVEAPITSPPTMEVSTATSPPTEWQITSIDWDDADSGDINGVRFRLSDIDAPETGGVGAAVGAAQCEAERTRGAMARDFMVELTRNAELRITNTYGYDRMREPRLLIDLSANGMDVGRAGIEAGHLAPWPHDGNRAQAPKPDWCAFR